MDSEEAPFWQQAARQPFTLSLVQPHQPPSNHAQAQPPYRVRPAGEEEAEKKIAARRQALMVDGKVPQITGTCPSLIRK